jgi:O-antigen/teichoic acid export membrane protein
MLKLIRNTLSNTGAKILTLILSLVATPVLIKALGDEGYALLMLIPSIMGYFDLLGGGVPGGTVKFVAEYEARGDWEMVNRIINSSLLFFTIIGLIAATGLTAFVMCGGLGAFDISPAFRWEARAIMLVGAGLSIVSWPVSALNSTLEGVQEHHAKNVVLTSTTLLSMVAALCAALLGASVFEVFLAQNVAYVIRWIWLTRVVHRLVPQWKPNPFAGSMDTFKMIFTLSAWMLALQIASMLNYKFDELVLGVALPVSMITVYNVITRPFKLVQQASSMFNSAVMPAVSNFESRDGRAALDVFIYTGVRYTNLLGASLAVTSTYFCAPFIALWVGERFLEWIWVAQVSCAFQMVWQSNSTLGRVFYGTGRVERIAMIALVSAVLNATLSIILVEHMGIAGVILATVIVGCLAVPAQYLLIFPLLEIPRWGYLKRSIMSAQWRHWVVGLAMIPLWGPIQEIRSWWMFVPCALLMLSLLLWISWRFGIEGAHKQWIRDAVRARLKRTQ